MPDREHEATLALVGRLHAARTMVALAVTGGGAGAIAALLRRPGGSRTVLEAQVPYGPAALADYLGRRPRSACSAATAVALARVAYRRALRLRPSDNIPVIGLGATAALVTDRPKRGAHRAHVATFDGFRQAQSSLRLNKGARSRDEEEALVERLILGKLAAATGVETSFTLGLGERDQLESREECLADPIDVLLGGEQPWLVFLPGGQVRPGGAVPAALLSGSFNPLHAGHRALYAAATLRLDGSAAYELSIANVDKPPLRAPEIRRRLEQFSGQAPVVLTRAPTFIEKARILPGTVFVLGADTALRVVGPDYYGGPEPMRAALLELRELGNRFLVAGRYDGGRFLELGDLDIPAEFRDLFEPVPAGELRVDISSSALRARQDENP